MVALAWIGWVVSSGGGHADHRASAPPSRRTVAEKSLTARRAGSDAGPASKSPRQGEEAPAGNSAAASESSPKVKDASKAASVKEEDEAEPGTPPSSVGSRAAAQPAEDEPDAPPPPARRDGPGEDDVLDRPVPPVAARPVAGPAVSPPPAPAADPLAGLGAVLPLPSLSKSKSDAEAGPVNLGPLPLADRKGLRFAVLGAGEVFGRNFTAAVAAVDEAKPGRWRVAVRKGDGAPQDLAEFRVESGQLRFAWAQNASDSHGDLLRNCFLEITAGKHQRCFALRQARAMKPLMIQNDKGAAQAHPLPAGGLPTGTPCQLEVLGLSGPPPYYTVCQPPKAYAPGKYCNLSWEDAAIGPVSVRVWLEPGFSVRTQLLLQPANDRNPNADRGFVAMKEKEHINKLTNDTARYVQGHPQLGPRAPGSRPPKPEATADYERKFAAQKQQYDLLKRLQRLDAFCASKTLHETVCIHFRVFTTVAGHRLDLVRSEPEMPERK